MAFQSTQKMRRTAASPSNSKASGPIRALQTFGLKGSDTSMPTAQLLSIDVQSGHGSLKIRRFSPDNAFHSGLPAARERKVLSRGAGIRRTGSFDMISSSSYLNGEWPKLSMPISHVCLTCEKSTQTSDDLSGFQSSDQLTRKSKVAAVANDCHKDVKSTCLTFHRSGSGLNLASPPAPCHAKPLPIPFLSRGRMTYHCHGSLEGLNQEIEKLVMHSNVLTDRVKSPVDGRCAPIAYQLNTCSRVTQTPTDCVLVQLTSEAEDQSRDDVPEDLEEYDIKAFKESPERVDFHSPKAVTSRLPPDGCEKVEGIFQEIEEDDGSRKTQLPFFKQPFIQFHIPSELSAFNPLVKSYLNEPVELACQFAGLATSQQKD